MHLCGACLDGYYPQAEGDDDPATEKPSRDPSKTCWDRLGHQVRREVGQFRDSAAGDPRGFEHVVKKTMRFQSMTIHLLAAVVISQLVSARSASAVDVLVTAATGHPYGVALIEIPVENPVIGRTFPPVEAAESAGRILHPISDDVRVRAARPSEQEVPTPGGGRLLGRVGNLIRELTSGEEDLEQTVSRRVSFLFTGSEPLRVRLFDAGGEIGTYEIVPRPEADAHREILAQWWQGYTDAAKRQIDSADYPALVENYLVAMLSGRTRMPLPDWYTEPVDDDELMGTLKLIGGAKGAGEAVFRSAAAGVSAQSPRATLPLPSPPRWAPPFAGERLDDVSVEPMATRVPPECFYLRYGSFTNYIWFRDLSKQHGADISKLVTLSSIENDASARIESQLNVESTDMSRLLGPSVIEDQAIIGRDLFLADGASIGVLFKATNAFLLRTSLNGDRTKLARDDPSVSLKEVKIADRTVTFLSSTDNRIRSYLIEDDGFFLVTNSKTMARRFLEVGESGKSLASTGAFRLARQLMPLERDDTIFVYFSPEMLRGLIEPEYLIELRRRFFAKADANLVHLARLAASQHAEAQTDAATGIDELVSLGFLPQGFGSRADGSGVVCVGDEVIDTRRGACGSFLPIADVEIDAVTQEEAVWYGRIAEQYTRRFSTIDPIMVGVQREELEDSPGIERITVHAEIAPWDPGKYGTIARQLGPPTRVAMKFAPDDIVAVQAHVASPQLGPQTHLFAAIKDTVPPRPEEFDGIFAAYRSLRQIPGYLGAWPQPGALDRLPLGLGIGQPVGPGMRRLIGGLYRYTDGEFSILSFQPEVMQASLPFLAATDVEDSAQVRIRVGNLYGSQLEGWVREQLYDRERQSSLAAANFLSLMTRQLKVDPDAALEAAERVLGNKMKCPLGGQYVYSPEAGRWTSTAWGRPDPPQLPPREYVAPTMNWFRGASATLTQYSDRVVADAVVNIARE